MVENIYAVSLSPSHPLMPISVVHLPPHKQSTASAPPSCLWLPATPMHSLHPLHSGFPHPSPSTSPTLPSQWLDLMVGPGVGRPMMEGGVAGRCGDFPWVLWGNERLALLPLLCSTHLCSCSGIPPWPGLSPAGDGPSTTRPGWASQGTTGRPTAAPANQPITTAWSL